MRKIILSLMIFSLLTGCIKKTNNDLSLISKGQWLNELLDTFGMDVVEEIELDWISNEDPYYYIILSSINWGIIEDKELELDEPLDYRLLIYSLYKTIFVDSNVMVINQMLEVLIKIGIVELKDIKLKSKVNQKAANLILTKAKELYLEDSTFIPRFEYQENNAIIPVADDSIEKIDQFTLSTIDYSLNVGDWIKLKDEYFKIDQVINNQNNNLLKVSELLFEEVIEELIIEEVFTPDLTNIEITNMDGVKITDMGLTNNYELTASNNIEKLSSSSIRYLNLDIGDLKVTGDISSNSISLKVQGNLNDHITLSETLSLSNLKISSKLDIKKFKINYGLLKIDYQQKNALSLKSQQYLDTNQLLTAKSFDEVKNMLNKSLLNPKQEANRSIDLLTFDIPVPISGNLISVKLVLGIQISVNGEVELTITSQQSNGIEIINNKPRFINDSSKDIKSLVEGNIEASAYLKMYLCALNQKIMDVSVHFGALAKASLTFHYVDMEAKTVNQEILIGSLNQALTIIKAYKIEKESKFIDTCLDVSIRWLLKFSAGEKGTLMNKIGLKYSYDFFEKSNPIISILHIEDHNIFKECQRKYLFINLEEQNSELLNLSSYREILAPQDILVLEVIALKEGYHKKDLIWESSDENIAIVKDGKVTALMEGSVVISVKTKDDVYLAQCFISIKGNNSL